MNVRLASNPVIAKLLDADRDTRLAVSTLLTYRVAGAEHSDAFKAGRWDGRSTFYDFKTDTFPAGFLNYVYNFLVGRGITIQVVKKPLPKPNGPERPVVDSFGFDPRYGYQMDTVDALLRHGQMIAQVATGGGKCLGKDTPVMMHDGTIKPVQDVALGDTLMGPDGGPRVVLSTSVGRSELFRVTPTKGDSYIVNDAHILSLKKTSRGYRGRRRDGAKYPKREIVNINVKDYLAETKTFRHIHKGWRTGVEFERRSLPIDPYLLGVILGDGTINGGVSVTTADQTIVNMLSEQASAWGLKLTESKKSNNKASTYALSLGMTGGKENPLMAELRKLGYYSPGCNRSSEKFIPHIYKTASREDRMGLLAGMLDADGHYTGKNMALTLKSERLFDDFLFVARSLGFSAYKSEKRKTCTNTGVTGTYFSMHISGELDKIPVRLERRKATARKQKKDHLVTGLTVESIGEGDYYGFEIDGDHLFLLGDFTVTHNTRIARLSYARIKRPTLFLTTRSVLMYQMKETFEENLGIKVGIMGDSEWNTVRGFNVGMVQTLAARLKKLDFECEVTSYLKKDAKRYQAVRYDKPALDAYMARVRKGVATKVNKHNKRRQQVLDFLATIEFVILEEAHESSGNSYFDILQKCKNAAYRLALTATPFMKEDEEANMRLMACSGPIGIQVTERMLIDLGILARPIFKYVDIPAPLGVTKFSRWPAAYKLGIVENDFRNRHIVWEAKRASERALPVMILIQREAHGKKLKELLKQHGVATEFINGKSDQPTRQAALNRLKNGTTKVLIGSTILDVGVDVPAVGMVILGGAGKAEVALRQRIGRGLRAKKGSNVCLIVDFLDKGNKYLTDHSSQRRGIVESTDGFVQNILPSNVDFDFDKLGL